MTAIAFIVAASVVTIVGLVANEAPQYVRHPVQSWRWLRALHQEQLAIKAVRQEAYDLLSAYWCDGSLVQKHTTRYNYVTNEYDEIPTEYHVCLEGAILVAAGWPAEHLYDRISGNLGNHELYSASAIQPILDKVELDRAGDVPETFDADLAKKVMDTLAKEIEGERRFRALVQKYGHAIENGQLLNINDDNAFGKEVVLEIVRDALFDGDAEVTAVANEALERAAADYEGLRY